LDNKGECAAGARGSALVTFLLTFGFELLDVPGEISRTGGAILLCYPNGRSWL